MELYVPWRLKRLLHRRSLRASLAERTIMQLGYAARSQFYRYPTAASESDPPEIFNDWWYYSIELFPGLVTKGIYPETTPLLPRMLMRNCGLRDKDCLDLGTMEGLMPTLMCRQDARSVMATDALFHCWKKLNWVRHYYQSNFSFRYIGTLYDLSSRLSLFGRKSFDFINLSGILYHVFSPMHVLAGVRPMMKKNGLIMVSTNIIERPGDAMEFNTGGRFQTEANTFWYLTPSYFDYMLRFFQLRPIDHLYHPFPKQDSVRYAQGFNTGYLSVMCRATDDVLANDGDDWLRSSIELSWENVALCYGDVLPRQPRSEIAYRGDADNATIDLVQAMKETEPVHEARERTDGHILHLADRS